jgi:hypothetical protein
MIDEARLLDDLIRLLKSTEDNIRGYCDEMPAVNKPLEERYEAARRAGRTGMTFNVWREGEITQAGVAWLLACVFVRFLEDNDLLGEVYLAGPGDRLRQAQERRTFWYRSHTLLSDREYLLDIFTELERLPGLKGLLDRDHNPLWSLGPDGDGAKAILDSFQSADPDSGLLRHDFTDAAQSTRFLGDLYQNISESARKRYALLQTPDFIVDFILDRTLKPAIEESTLEGFRLIDPACGSGHFLLAAFERLFPLWANREGDLTVVARNTLNCIYGVDLNPYAAAIARFRLLVAALRACGITKMAHAPDWQIHVTTGDSLLFGPNNMVPSLACLPGEDPEQLRITLQAQAYHVVIGNPPYINVQDPELRRIYRGYYKSCSGKYQASVPFTELFFNLAEHDGHIGMITSNAFMKRNFGTKLIEECLPKWDMTHVIDTSWVHLPGHATPTVILIGRNREPVASTLRVVRGIRGEVTAPKDPRNAPVWSEIRDHVDQPGFEGQKVSVADAVRESFHLHPWSIGGGGASELKELIEKKSVAPLASTALSIGYMAITGEDDVYLCPERTLRRSGIPYRLFCEGEGLRHWQCFVSSAACLPTDHNWFWSYRTVLKARLMFGKTAEQMGKPWYAYMFVYLSRFDAERAVAFSDVATHNSFVLVQSGLLLNRHAPLILMDAAADESNYSRVLGLLNSSCACFWLRQTCSNKGTGGIGGGIATESWEFRFEFDSTKLSQLPLPSGSPLELATAIQSAAGERSTLLPAAVTACEVPTRASLDAARARSEALLLRMIALQEELDWQVYHLYGLLDESLTLPIDQVPPVRLGERAFEIVMARAMEAGELETEWFARHGSTPRTTIPELWSEPYRALVQRRLDTIARDHDIALIEQPEYKRRWNLPAWDELEREALRNWLLDRLEDARYWPTEPPALTSVARLADAVRLDSEFLQVAGIYRGRPDYDLPALVQGLVAKESVPFLPVLRYKEPGRRKRDDWEHTWNLQRREDRGETVENPVPPRYEKDDFLSADFWRLRGKLDVPKERFISYPYLERDADKSPVIAWAGYDLGQQALALASYCNEMRGMEAWTAERLLPILAGLQELQPWLDQWHAEIDPHRQQRLNESIRTFFESELTHLGITAEQVRGWCPPLRKRRTSAAGNNK